MTIKLLTDWPYKRASGNGSVTIPAGNIVGVFDSATEAGMIASKVALSSVGAVTWTPPDEAPIYDGLTALEVTAVRAVVSEGGIGARSPFLRKSPQTLKKGWMGKVASVANGADHTSSYFTTLETHADRIRIWVLNPVAAALVNVRVSVGSSDTVPAPNLSLHGSANTAGGNLSNGALATSATFTVAAGTDANTIGATASPWLDLSTISREDGGTLPAIRIRVEIPTAGNANRPAHSTTAARSGWELEGDAATAPFGRLMRCRVAAGLGVTTPSAAQSTAFADDAVPIVIEYAPRLRPGVTLTAFGDSITEGADAAIVGHGYLYEARALVSTMDRPLEICNLAAAATLPAEYMARAEAMIPLLLPELVMISGMSPNGITAPNFTTASNVPLLRRAVSRTALACGAAGSAMMVFGGIPISPANKDLDATGAANLAAYIAEQRATGYPLLDTYFDMSSGVDADGQVLLNPALATSVHPTTAGYRDVMAPKLVALLRSLSLA